MTKPAELKARFDEVKQRIGEAAARSGRSGDDVLLVAVTKNAQPEQVRQLIELGHADFGENRVQNLTKRVAAIDEFLERHRAITSSKPVQIPEQVRWHMIGHLQRNKVKKVLGLVTLIHSLDTLRLAEEIQEAASKHDAPADVLIQVNASGEESKFGCAIPAVRHLAELIDTMVGLRLRGLMTMAPLKASKDEIRETFMRCAEAFEDLRADNVGGKKFNLLSMGMTNDYEIAVECGANLVRIGTAIFGSESGRGTSSSENRDADEDSENEPAASQAEGVPVVRSSSSSSSKRRQPTS